MCVGGVLWVSAAEKVLVGLDGSWRALGSLDGFCRFLQVSVWLVLSKVLSGSQLVSVYLGGSGWVLAGFGRS